MNLDQLFVIKPDFTNQSDTAFYCPGCAEVLGLIQYYPKLESALKIRYVEFARPRPEIVELIGVENQGSPVLILANSSKPRSSKAKIKESNGHLFIDDSREIGIYLSEVHGIGSPYPPEA